MMVIGKWPVTTAPCKVCAFAEGAPGVLAVIDAVGHSGHTAYDAAYVVLAESAGAMRPHRRCPPCLGRR
ncbi:MAG: hypothetical protein ACRDGV_09575 [Candidatus Limnocylindria bacterium]